MNILIGCEESQTITKAFRELGNRHYAPGKPRQWQNNGAKI